VTLLTALPLIILQFSIVDLEQRCAVTETPEQIQECNYSRRINYGPYSLEQLPDLIELYVIHRTQGEYDEAVEVAHMLKWLVIKNDSSGYIRVMSNLTYLPEEVAQHECFLRSARTVWMYANNGECNGYRLMIADSHILAYDLAKFAGKPDAMKAIAKKLSVITAGILGLPLTVIREYDGSLVEEYNTDIPNKYRADLWLMRSR
jgi:hypothetical protein